MRRAQEIIDRWLIRSDPAEPLDLQMVEETVLPPIPEGVRILAMNNSGVTELPQLPSTLRRLSCYYTRIQTISNLPEGLTHLIAYGNRRLVEIVSLPDSLQELDVYFCGLTKLPALPRNLVTLNCRDNRLTEIPDLPPNVRYAYLDTNQLVRLPLLPTSLRTISIFSNPRLLHNYNAYENMLRNYRITMQQFVQYSNAYTRNLRRANIKAVGRNVETVQRLQTRNTANTPANWYAGPQEATTKALSMNNILGKVSEFVSGKRGNVSMQQRALQQNLARTGGGKKKSRSRKTRKSRKN